MKKHIYRSPLRLVGTATGAAAWIRVVILAKSSGLLFNNSKSCCVSVAVLLRITKFPGNVSFGVQFHWSGTHYTFRPFGLCWNNIEQSLSVVLLSLSLSRSFSPNIYKLNARMYNSIKLPHKFITGTSELFMPPELRTKSPCTMLVGLILQTLPTRRYSCSRFWRKCPNQLPFLMLLMANFTHVLPS